MNDLYDTDVLLWSERQAALLRRRAAGELINEADGLAARGRGDRGRGEAERAALATTSPPSSNTSPSWRRHRRPNRAPAGRKRSSAPVPTSANCWRAAQPAPVAGWGGRPPAWAGGAPGCGRAGAGRRDTARAAGRASIQHRPGARGVGPAGRDGSTGLARPISSSCRPDPHAPGIPAGVAGGMTHRMHDLGVGRLVEK